MTCSDCGQDTLSDGVCIDCSSKRFDDYPRLKRMESRLDKKITELDDYLKKNENVGDGGLEVEFTLSEELKKIKEGKS